MKKNKKDKKIKIDDISKDIIAALKKEIDSDAATGAYGTFLGYEEEHTKYFYKLSAVFDRGSYKVKITYTPNVLLFSNIIDLEYEINGENFLIYDIFNLFDISDFEQYYFSDLSTEAETGEAVRSLLDVAVKYDYDVKKAAQEENFERLKQNRDTDIKNGFNDGMTDEEIESEVKDCIEMLGVVPNHPVCSYALDTTDSAKLLKKLEKQDKKGKIETLYEKRLLEYLRGGNKFENKNAENKKAFEKTFKKQSFLADFVCIVCGMVFAVVVALIARSIVYSRYELLTYSSFVGNIPIHLPNEGFFGVALGMIMLAGAFVKLFGKKLLSKLVKGDKTALQRYEAEKNSENGKKIKPAENIIVIVVLLVIGIAGITFTATNNFGFGENGVKFTSSESFIPETVSYDDLEIYSLKYFMSDEENKTEYENGYAVSDGKGGFYELGEVAPGGETEKRLLSVAEKYGKEIKTVNTAEDIKK